MRKWMVAGLWMLGACARSAAEPAPRAVTQMQPETESHDLESPLRVRWVRVGETPGGVTGGARTLRMHAVFERTGVLGIPLQVEVERPAGVTQRSGPSVATVAPLAQGVTTTLAYEFEVAPGATGGLVLVADGRASDRGFHTRLEEPLSGVRAAVAEAPRDNRTVMVGGIAVPSGVAMNR